jgi:hypothetical protein
MLPMNVSPASQGFPRAPDGGTIVPTPIDTLPPNRQAFAPAPLVNPFPIEPTAPLAPVQPAKVGPPMIPVAFTVVPPALEVAVVAETLVPVNVPNFVVTDQGSYQSTASAALVDYIIAIVVDNDTGLPPVLTPPPLVPPQTAAVNLLVSLVPNGKPLTSYGVSLAGRNVQFTVSLSAAARVISANGVADITVPNAGFIPVVGDTAIVAGQPYVVNQVVDALTGLYPTPASLNLKVTLTGAGFTINDKVGQTAQFFVSVTVAERPILVYSDFAVVVPVNDANGVPFLPAAGDIFAVDTARYDAELVSQNTGAGEQNVVPSTQALPLGFTAPAGSLPVYLPALGAPSSGLPVPSFVVNDQQLTSGTPKDITPGITEQNGSVGQQDVLVGSQSGVLGQPINVYPGAQNR